MPSGVPEQMIGAAARDAKVQAAAREAANDPEVQRAAWNHGTAAARDTASAGAAFVKKEFVEVKTYIQENHCSVQILCFCIALMLLVSSVLGVINIFDALVKPYQYLFAFYNVLFAVAIIVMDGKPEWFTRCCDLQRKLYSAAPILATRGGRGGFYFYVGSINLCMLPQSWLWKIIYLTIGGSLCFAGLAMWFRQCCGAVRNSRAAGQQEHEQVQV